MTEKSVAQRLEEAIDRSGKSQREIARDVGYQRANIISMMKNGETKVPIEKAPLLAKACGIDPADFTRHVLEEYHPAAWATLAELFGKPLTRREKACIDAYREIVETLGHEPEIGAQQLRNAIEHSR